MRPRRRKPTIVKPRNILGIDPGKSGGFAFVGDHILEVAKMPATDTELWVLVEGLASQVDVCYIEHVHSMHGEGVRSVFTFGYGYGGLRMALVAAKVRTELVPPNVWCKSQGLRRKKSESNTDWKNRHKELAQRLFPGLRSQITHHVADALLIADFGRRAENMR